MVDPLDDTRFVFDPGADFQYLAEGETRQVSFTYTATDSHGAVSNTAKRTGKRIRRARGIHTVFLNRIQSPRSDEPWNGTDGRRAISAKPRRR